MAKSADPSRQVDLEFGALEKMAHRWDEWTLSAEAAKIGDPLASVAASLVAYESHKKDLPNGGKEYERLERPDSADAESADSES
jgi:hypothetical protein